MRWTTILSTLALLMATATGCKQQCFLKECDEKHYRDNLAGRFLEFDPEASQKPASVVHNFSGSPPTVLDPDRPKRYLSLAEAISIALEQGTRGQGIGTGVADDTLVRFQGFGGPGGPLFSDSIRVLALNPAISALGIDSALSKFDAFFTSSLIWNTTDRPIGTALDAFQAGRAGALNSINTDAATFTSSLLKPLPTGGTAGITFNTQYQFTNLPARVNPSYTPSLTFALEQPLLQGFGVEINELRSTHPGSQLLQSTLPGAAFAGQAFGGGRLAQNEGILLTRIRFDQERTDFEASVDQMLLNVEVAYWNLYGTYWTLYSRELGLRLAYEFYRIVNARYVAGGVGPMGQQPTRLQDVARARGQYELFRGQRLEALGSLLEAERQLRKFLSLPAEDGTRLVPSDTPTVAPYQPDWLTAKQEALTLRPEVIIARENIKRAQLEMIRSKNDLLPDLRAFGTWDINSIGSELSGPGPANAFGNLSDNKFHNFAFGVRANIPLGFRDAYAVLRRNRLELARSYALLKDQELKADSYLRQQYSRLFEFHERIKAQRAQREAYALQLRLEFERVRVGQTTVADRDTAILEAQRFFSDALSAEYAAIVGYNNTLASFEYAKGTLLHHNNVSIAEGPLPTCAAEQAVEHYRKRNVALVLAERSHPLHCADCNDALNLPHLPEYGAASLPALQANAPKVPDGRTPEELPPPKPTGEPRSALPGSSLLDQPLPTGPTPASGPAATLGAPPAGTGQQNTPPARSEQFGASRMLPPSVNSRDSAPSLQPPSIPSPPTP
ncbi:MAG TPA: TolC family protein [Gemmataceae bacterium]|nr:TolC family protein [Gemmataceae bacterium]